MMPVLINIQSPEEAVMFDGESPQAFSQFIVSQLVGDHLRLVLNLSIIHRHRANIHSTVHEYSQHY